MIKKIDSFNADLKKFSDGVGVSVQQVVKLAGLKLFTGVVKKTPVRTGVARSSWVIGIGHKPPPFVSTGKQDDATILARANKIKATGKLTPVFISSYVPYIKKLENGTSRQAPNGMVALTMLEVQNELKAAIK